MNHGQNRFSYTVLEHTYTFSWFISKASLRTRTRMGAYMYMYALNSFYAYDTCLNFFLTDSLWTFYLTEISRITSLQHLNVETYTSHTRNHLASLKRNTILCSWIGKTRNLKKIEITVFNHCLFSSFLHICLIHVDLFSKNK